MMTVSIWNGVSVALFGVILAAAFCDIQWTKKKHLFMTGALAALLLLQGMICFFADIETVRILYPFITHFPLMAVLSFFSKKPVWSMVAVFTGYLCCYVRRWLALFIVTIYSGDVRMQNVTELLITIPLLVVLIKFIAPSVRTVSHYSMSIQIQFGLIPVLSYIFDYMTQIYTDWFAKGNPVVVEFMSFVCSASYLSFVVRTSKEQKLRNQLENTQDCLNLQVTQAVREIELLREAQQKANVYRHDLRHHMQYLSACIENDKLEQAQIYIREICSEVETNKISFYCENEAANLIFSAFAERAKEHEISIKIRAMIPRNLNISECDLCVMLSNALENALHACQERTNNGFSGKIEVSAYEKKGRFFLQMINSCDENIIFEQGIPVTNEPDHGMGVRSICALVEKYGGIYSFSVKEGQFILRISI